MKSKGKIRITRRCLTCGCYGGVDEKGNPVEEIRILPEYISEEEKKAIASVLECKNCREKRLKLERR